MLKYEVDRAKLQKSMKEWAKKFGDNEKQMVARLAVAVARGAAVRCAPAGKARKTSIANIDTGTNINTHPLPAREFSALLSSPAPKVRLGGRWVNLNQGQILRTVDDIWTFIEASRTSGGHVKRLPPEQRGICRAVDLGKVKARRRKLAGIAKGSFLGAGKSAGRFQRGAARVTIGKNFMSWAQKHGHFGHARRIRGGIALESNAMNTRHGSVWSRKAHRLASHEAWERTLKWYRRAYKKKLS